MSKIFESDTTNNIAAQSADIGGDKEHLREMVLFRVAEATADRA